MGRPPYWKKNTNGWTRLTQGFENSHTLFRGALAVDLSTFLEETPSCTFLQYMADLLLGSHNQEKC
jgi:hypothetical protein